MPVTLNTTTHSLPVPVVLPHHPLAGDIPPEYGPHPLNRFLVTISLPALRRAALMVGHPRGTWSSRHSDYREWRQTAINLALHYRHGTAAVSGHGGLHHLLERAEKSAVTGALGNAMTKILSEQILGARWLFFTDLYERKTTLPAPGKYWLVFNDQKQRGDFFAQIPSGEWVSIEAKGRVGASKLDREEAMHAKAQAEALLSVNFNAVKAHIVSAVFVRKEEVTAEFYDPPKQETTRLETTEENLLRSYYRHVTELVDTDFPKSLFKVGNSPVVMVTLPRCGFSAGLHPRVSSLLKGDCSRLNLKHLEKELHNLKVSGTDNTNQLGELHCGPDGVLIGPDFGAPTPPKTPIPPARARRRRSG
jgi:hypothetical protein